MVLSLVVPEARGCEGCAFGKGGEFGTEVLDAARRLAERETAIEAEVRAGVPLPRAMRDARLAGTETT
jgi:hypothetical protein